MVSRRAAEILVLFLRARETAEHGHPCALPISRILTWAVSDMRLNAARGRPAGQR